MRAWNLGDKDLLEIIRNRGAELATLKAFVFLERMFQTVAAKNAVAKPGIEAAIGLMHIYSQHFAPGHPEHPFKQYGGLSVQGVFASIPVGKRPPLDRESPKPAPKPAPVLVVDAGTASLGAHVAKVLSTPAPVAREFNDRMPRVHKAVSGKENKVGAIREFVLGLEGVFTPKGVRKQMADSGKRYSSTDIHNAFMLMRRSKLIAPDPERSYGGYVVLRESV